MAAPVRGRRRLEGPPCRRARGARVGRTGGGVRRRQPTPTCGRPPLDAGPPSARLGVARRHGPSRRPLPLRALQPIVQRRSPQQPQQAVTVTVGHDRRRRQGGRDARRTTIGLDQFDQFDREGIDEVVALAERQPQQATLVVVADAGLPEPGLETLPAALRLAGAGWVRHLTTPVSVPLWAGP